MKKPLPAPTRAALTLARKKASAIAASLGGTYRVRIFKLRTRRHFLRRHMISPEESARRIWDHDFEVLLDAAARTSATPAEAIDAASKGADAMARTTSAVPRGRQLRHVGEPL